MARKQARARPGGDAYLSKTTAWQHHTSAKASQPACLEHGWWDVVEKWDRYYRGCEFSDLELRTRSPVALVSALDLRAAAIVSTG